MKKVLIDKKGKKYYWDSGDLHTALGVIKEEDIKKKKMVKSHIKKELFVHPAYFIDKLKKIKRGPAIMLQKDIGAIIAYTGINKESIVLDAGAGSGVLSSYLAGIVKKVISYERNKEFLNIAKKNFDFLNLKNITLKEKDIYTAIDEKNLDLITLDLAEPWNVLKSAETALKEGCFLVSYLPNVTQIMKLVEEARKFSFIHEKTIELIEREWHVEDLRVRPKSRMIGHTGFLCFFRKI